MQQVSRSAMMPYPASALYDLVNDIESYPKFLPWCRAVTVLERDLGSVIARLEIHKGGITQQFTTRNTLTPTSKIELNLTEGPFKHLHGTWSFHPLADNACKIDFQMEFEFSNRIMHMMLNPMFDQAASTMLTAFCERARQVLGDA